MIDHHQGVCLYLVKVTEYLKFKKLKKKLKNTEFKIPTINSSDVAAIHVEGVRGDRCGAVRWTVISYYLYNVIYITTRVRRSKLHPNLHPTK